LTGIENQETANAAEHTPSPGISRLVIALAALTVLMHFATNLFSPYGIQRDEFLYLAMGRHLHLWRMEFPPAIAILAKFSHTLLGDSIFAIRFFAAIASGVLVYLSAKIAANLGGSRTAQIIAALAVLTSPLFLRAGNLFQPVVFDQLAWTVAIYALVRLVRTENPKWWIWFGIAAGLGLLTKFSAIFFGTAALLAVIVSPQRKWFLTPWPWVAMGIALVLGSPSVVGQIVLDYPVLKQMQDLKESQLERVTPSVFIAGQVQLGPGFLLALGGLISLLIVKPLRRFSIAGWTCLFAFFILMILHGKDYYLGPVYPALWAAGACAIELVSRQRMRIALEWIAIVLLVGFGLLTLPIGIPILPPEQMAKYSLAIGATSALRNNQGELDRLPQDYADMIGWPEQVQAVADVYKSLPPADRVRAVVLAANYGEAGAIDYYGPNLGLPNAISPAGTYWFFGPGSKPGDVAVALGIEEESLKRFFREVTLVRTVGNPWSVGEERKVPIFIARSPYKTLQEVWPSLAGRN
jgi:hypothetical protein